MKGLQVAADLRLDLEVVTEATAIVATRGAGKSSTSAVIIEEAFDAGVQTVVFDRTGVYWGLRSNARGTGPGLGIYVLGGPHGDAPLEPAAGRLIADLVVDSGHSFVLDLSDLSKAAAVKFAADLLERLYDRKARSRTTTLLVMDEAHFYAPQTPRGGFKGDSARLMGAMEDVVGLGRSRGLGVVLTTQRTQALNKAVLDLIETLFVMRMLSPRARDAVQEWIREKHEDDRVGVIATLESLPTGTAWVWSPLRGVLVKIAVRRIRTFDSYATPKPGQSRAEPKKRAELDLAALGDEIRATAERAKENDPAELRRRIADLQRDLDAAKRDTGWSDADWARVRQAAAATGESAVEEVLAVYTETRTAFDLGYSCDVVDEVRALADRAELTPDDWQRLERLVGLLGEVADHVASDGAAFRDELGLFARKLTAHKSASAPTPRRPDAAGYARPAAPAPPHVTDLPGQSANGHVTGPQQRILDALAWFEAIGIPAPRRPPLAGVAGVKASSGGFRANVSTLSGSGLIRYPETGRVELTDEGRAKARPPGIAPTEQALHDAVLATVTGPQAAILRALIAAYPEAIARDDLAAAVGVQPTSGGFRANVSTLSGLELVEYPDRGTVRAADLLFVR